MVVVAFSCPVSVSGIGVVVTAAALESVAFVVVVVVIFPADISPSSSPVASPLLLLLSLLATPRENAQKYSAIQLNTIVQLHYLMYCCSTYWMQCSSDLPFNLSYTTLFLTAHGPQSRNQKFSSQ